MEDGTTTIVLTPAETRAAALSAFSRLSRAFAAGFDDSEPQAYATLLKDLMDHAALLVDGNLMSAKEVLDKIEDLQQHIHKRGGSTKTVADEFSAWFNAPTEASA